MNQSSQKALHLSADKVRHDPVHSDYLWLELILSNDYDDKTTTPNCPVMGLVWSGQVRKGLVRSGHVRSSKVRSSTVKPGQVRSGQVRSGQVRSGQVRSGQAKTGDIR